MEFLIIRWLKRGYHERVNSLSKEKRLKCSPVIKMFAGVFTGDETNKYRLEG